MIKKLFIGVSVSTVALVTFTQHSFAESPELFTSDKEIESTLKRFRENSIEFMNELPKKYDGNGNPVTINTSPYFDAQNITLKYFVTNKDNERAKLPVVLSDGSVVPLKSLGERAGIESNDQAKVIAELPEKPSTRELEAIRRRDPERLKNLKYFITTLSEMDEKKLLQSSLEEKNAPWSDDYWPIYKGQLADRYSFSENNPNNNWKKNKEHFLKYKDSFRDSTSLDDLSPAEKYDLLVGDVSESFTNYMWNQGEYYFKHSQAAEDSEKVETWMGICHGWAPAAYMLPRPENAVSVVAADGITKLKFYPSDIKALGSQLWATARTGSLFIGGRCNQKDPKKDKNGRVLDQDCFDNNPGAWHLSVVNRIGVKQKSFVIDATYDYEVWNQPVFKYKYTYFNPQTGKRAKSLESATVSLNEYTNDKFKNHRDPNSTSVVGVVMELTYVVETRPTHFSKDSFAQDAHRTATYIYDIELNRDGEIIGGEWYQNTHPDFLWTPATGAVASAPGDRYIRTSWDGTTALPSDWKNGAYRSSPYGLPLGSVVNTLITLSKISGE